MRKRFHILIFAVFVTICTNAQLKVHTDGDIGIDVTDPVSDFQIGSIGTSYAKVSFYNSSTSSSSRGLAVYQEPTSSWAYGSVASVRYGTGGSGSHKLVGAYGSAYRGSTPTLRRTYGLYGITGNGYDGFNYGVYGYLLGDRDGAAVFGTTNGDVDIPGNYAGYFSGNVYITGTLSAEDVTDRSDASLKKDIRNLESNNVEKIQQLNGVKYKFRHQTELDDFVLPQNDSTTLESLQKDLDSPKYTSDRIGLIAQDLQKVFPELVVENDEGYLAIRYNGLIPILVEAIKEQQIEIESLKQDIVDLQSAENNGPSQLE